MKHKYSPVEKRVIVGCYKDGKSVSCISQDTGIPRSTIYSWLKQDVGSSSNPKEFTRKDFLVLQKKVERLEGIIKILKNAECLPDAPLSTKLNALEKLHEQSWYSVHMLCEALDVPRGTSYNHILRNKREHTWYVERREELRESIQRIYDDNHQIFGAEKIATVMKEEGSKVSVEMVRELMQEMGLTSIGQDAKSMYEKEQRKLKNQLNQQFNVSRPDEVWVSDVTYFRFNDNKFYICAIIDLFARKVISYKIGKSNSTQLVKSTFRAAYETRRPCPLSFHKSGLHILSTLMCREMLYAVSPRTTAISEAHILESMLQSNQIIFNQVWSDRAFSTSVYSAQGSLWAIFFPPSMLLLAIISLAKLRVNANNL